MNVFAITLTWNGMEHLKRLKRSLDNVVKNLDSKIKFYWFVKDNNSSDATEKTFTEKWTEDWIKYFRFVDNRDNYAEGNNYLYEKVKKFEKFNKNEDIILYLNNDIIFDDGAKSLEKMLDLFNDDVGIVGAKLLYPSGKLQHAGVIFSKKMGNLPFHLKRGRNDDVYTKVNREFQAVTFACAMVKPTCIDALPGGKMDEKYVWCWDDVNTCLQICKIQNKKIIYCGQTVITHGESETLKRNPINQFFFKQNCALFRKDWDGKYDVDEERYLADGNYRIVRGH